MTAPPGTRRRVAVIGAGPCGLVALKELLERGHDAIAFDPRERIGGTFTRTRPEMALTTNNVSTAFGAMPDPSGAGARFWTSGEYLGYLNAYADRFGLRSRIRLGAKVTEVRRAGGDAWEVAFHSPSEVDGDARSSTEVGRFDCVGTATGFAAEPVHPELPGQGDFAGEIVHSSDLRDQRQLEGRRVLVIGLGESGSDIALLAGRLGAASAVSTRSGAGYVIPRRYRGLPADRDTNRCYHAIPRWLVRTQAMRFKTRIEELMLGPGDDRALVNRIRELNELRGISPFQRFATKTEGFVEAMLVHGTEYKPGLARLERDRAVFEDGTSFRCDLVALCTGYRPAFPFLASTEPAIAADAKVARGLYKHMLHPDVGPGLAWIGYVRPGIGNIPACAEMQARYLALLLSGERRLPSAEEMRRDIALNSARDQEQFPVDAERLGGLTDYMRFMEGVAGLIGCRPSLPRLALRDPRTAAKAFFGPLGGSQYRLRGPGADPDVRAAIRAAPTMPWPVLAYELLFYLAGRLLAPLGDRWSTRLWRRPRPWAARARPERATT